MASPLFLPAAQYLRTSTRQQPYSIESQEEAILEYARRKGFFIARSYMDIGRSGLTLNNRPGLSSLLNDLIEGTCNCRAVLVYDISRWGRFQDLDESAHYEFICRLLNVEVHYCAESFANDGEVSTFILKTLKRAMAAEYSRDLSSKCFQAQKSLAQSGFRVGGATGYGLRRMAISQDGSRTELRSGEYKSLSMDRVVLVPGPEQELSVVRTIFAMAAAKGSTYRGIAAELNKRGIPYRSGRPWKDFAVQGIIKSPKYIGTTIWNRISGQLGTIRRHNPPEQWISVANALMPIVDSTVFEQAQRVHPNGHRWAKQQLLARAQELQWKSSAFVTGGPSFSTLRRRLPGLPYLRSCRGTRLYRDEGTLNARQRLAILRNTIFDTLRGLFPHNLTEFHLPEKSRPLLRLDGGMIVSVLVCGYVWRKTGIMRWRLRPIRAESNFVTLVCLELSNRTRYFLVPRVNVERSRLIGTNDTLLKTGMRLTDLVEFLDATKAFSNPGCLQSSISEGRS